MRRYATIVADPPWKIGRTIPAGGRRRRSTEVPYEMLSIDEICALPVASLAAEQAHLYLWATRKVFREGWAARVARAWGFEPVGEIVWGLRNAGMGGGFNGNGHEPVLLASRGGLGWPRGVLPGGVQFWRQTYLRGKVHSAKPEAFLDLVEELSPEPRLEMFARRTRFGWDSWGDQALQHVEMPA